MGGIGIGGSYPMPHYSNPSMMSHSYHSGVVQGGPQGGPVGSQGPQLPMQMTPHHQPYPQSQQQQTQQQQHHNVQTTSSSAPTLPSGNIPVSGQNVLTQIKYLLVVSSMYLTIFLKR